jgi:hypothetical protein
LCGCDQSPVLKGACGRRVSDKRRVRDKRPCARRHTSKRGRRETSCETSCESVRERECKRALASCAMVRVLRRQLSSSSARTCSAILACVFSWSCRAFVAASTDAAPALLRHTYLVPYPSVALVSRHSRRLRLNACVLTLRPKRSYRVRPKRC